MKQSELIHDLSERTKRLIDRANEYMHNDVSLLNQRPEENAWSVLECLEHLNLYGDFYLPEIAHRIHSAKKIEGDPDFKSGWFGERTVTGMLPKEDKVSKMRTFKNKTPNPSALSIATIDRFIEQQETMLRLLQEAKNVRLNRVKTDITLPLIRFYLGTTLRFVIYHNQRHLWQADRALRLLEA
ncbi:MAG: DinB family protein [Cryomorphaceae bacterium]